MILSMSDFCHKDRLPIDKVSVRIKSEQQPNPIMFPKPTSVTIGNGRLRLSSDDGCIIVYDLDEIVGVCVTFVQPK